MGGATKYVLRTILIVLVIFLFYNSFIHQPTGISEYLGGVVSRVLLLIILVSYTIYFISKREE